MKNLFLKVPIDVIKNTPIDQQLGEAVRTAYLDLIGESRIKCTCESCSGIFWSTIPQEYCKACDPNETPQDDVQLQNREDGK